MSIPLQDWSPPHCPNPKCSFHRHAGGWAFIRTGFFTRHRAPHRVQRYRCTHCHRCFSTQTFRASYWLKRPDLLAEIFHGEVTCSGHRQTARRLGVAHSTVQRQTERLGRHCLLVHEELRPRARRQAASEPVVLDGLGSFAGGQYWPLELSTVAGVRSYYSHDFVVTEQRRRGRMRPDQRRRRAAYESSLGRPSPTALTRDVRDLLEAVIGSTRRVELRTDEKREYGAALAKLADHRIARRTTHSKRPRTPLNPLFAINSHHMFMRHSAANHKRETIAFAKRLQAVIYRHSIFQVWRNTVKSAAERHPGVTPAQRLGVLHRQLRIQDLLLRRRFPTRFALRPRSEAYYWGRVRSRFCRGEHSHELRYAT